MSNPVPLNTSLVVCRLERGGQGGIHTLQRTAGNMEQTGLSFSMLCQHTEDLQWDQEAVPEVRSGRGQTGVLGDLKQLWVAGMVLGDLVRNKAMLPCQCWGKQRMALSGTGTVPCWVMQKKWVLASFYRIGGRFWEQKLKLFFRLVRAAHTTSMLFML